MIQAVINSQFPAFACDMSERYQYAIVRFFIATLGVLAYWQSAQAVCNYSVAQPFILSVHISV